MDPILLFALLLSAVWYWGGSRRPRLRVVGRRAPTPSWRVAAFYSGLAAIALALLGPVDSMSDKLLWAHMLQHLLLMGAAAPLLVLGAPWLPFWRPLPLAFRRRVAGAVVQSPRLAWLRSTARFISLPVVAWVLFNGDLAFWHVPALYDLTLRNTAVHYVEHLSFLAFGMLFWAQAFASPPFHPRIGDFQRVAFLTAGATAAWLLAVVLALSPTPLYRAYVSVHPRPEGLSALADQQLAAGAMWGPGSVPYALGVFWLLYAWLGEDGGGRRRPRHRRSLTPTGEPR
ncbi:MAG: cytochrome c oxidase assembly protein [Gaiellaceae bacterium]